MTLPDDTCRCHDEECGERESCLRWLHRNRCGQHATHCESMFPFDYHNDEPCPYRIPEESQ